MTVAPLLLVAVLRFVPIDQPTAAAEQQASQLGVDRRRCDYRTDYRTGPPRRCWSDARVQTAKGGAAPGGPASRLVRSALEFGKEVTQTERSARRTSLEGLLRRGNELAAELRRNLEHLSVEDDRSVERGMRGFFVNREEVIIVEPDVRFFSKLAEEIGTAEDRIYFGYMLKVRTIEEVGREITQGVCACGKTSSVEKELRTFLELNPNAPIAAAVRARLSALDGGTQVVRENCVGGQ